MGTTGDTFAQDGYGTWDFLIHDVQEDVVKRLSLREAARFAMLSRGCRSFYRSRLSQRQARLLEVLQKGVPGRITGPQLGFLRRLLCDALRGRLFGANIDRFMGGPKRPFYIDSEGKRLRRRSVPGCMEVFLGWDWNVENRGPGHPEVWTQTLPWFIFRTPGGVRIEVSGDADLIWDERDRLPLNLADFLLRIEYYQSDDVDWVCALVQAVSLFVFEKGFEEREDRWAAIPKSAGRGRQKTRVLIERAPRVLAVQLRQGCNMQGTAEGRALEGMQGLVAGAKACGYFHVGPYLNGAGPSDDRANLALALKRRELIKKDIACEGAGAVLLVRVVSGAGFEAEGVIPCQEVEPTRGVRVPVP